MGAVVEPRPAGSRLGRYRVDLHEFDQSAHVIVRRGRAIASHRDFDAIMTAVTYARGVADAHECPLIRLNHQSGDESA